MKGDALPEARMVLCTPYNSYTTGYAICPSCKRKLIIRMRWVDPAEGEVWLLPEQVPEEEGITPYDITTATLDSYFVESCVGSIKRIVGEENVEKIRAIPSRHRPEFWSEFLKFIRCPVCKRKGLKFIGKPPKGRPNEEQGRLNRDYRGDILEDDRIEYTPKSRKKDIDYLMYKRLMRVPGGTGYVKCPSCKRKFIILLKFPDPTEGNLMLLPEKTPKETEIPDNETTAILLSEGLSPYTFAGTVKQAIGEENIAKVKAIPSRYSAEFWSEFVKFIRCPVCKKKKVEVLGL